MPELPDVTVYVERLARLTTGSVLERVRIRGPFLLRTVDPPVSDLEGKRVQEVLRLGKRIVISLEGELFAVIHLMIAGRLHWRDRGAALPGKLGLAAFDFTNGTLLLTEAGTKKRASLHVLRSRATLTEHDPGGLEVLASGLNEFAEALRRENHTLKRALTDPRLLSGIGNACSDEILHRARLSPVKLTSRLDEEEMQRLYDAARAILAEWTARIRVEAGDGLPEKVTAFRPGMGVHGRYGQPCPTCGTLVQRIIYAENETNYCPRCQTGGKLLADRSLSRLLRADWPRTVDDLA